MPLSKQQNFTIYDSGLNDKLVDSHYPHLAKKLFDNLALPPGLIVKNKPTSQNVCIYNSKDTCIDCMDNKQWDQLFKLGEIKSGNKKTRKRKQDSKKQDSKKQDSKKKAKKSRKK